jgi:hypothetical protein
MRFYLAVLMSIRYLKSDIGNLRCDVIAAVTSGAGGVWLSIASAAVLMVGGAAAQTTLGHARTVLAAVVSSQGRPLVDVGLDDFVVTEGTEPREVIDVHVADYPLAVIIDDRHEAADALPLTRAAARRFIERVGERPVALYGLSSATPRATLDAERTTVLETLASLSTAESVTPVSSPLDTIAQAAALLQASGAPFSAVIVVAGAPVAASTLVRGELLPLIQSSGAAVHVVQGQAGSNTPPDAEADLLQVIAGQTRGQFTPIFSTASFGAALDRLADRLAIEMMVQYEVPAGPKTGDVQVGVRIPGARVVGLGVK